MTSRRSPRWRGRRPRASWAMTLRSTRKRRWVSRHLARFLCFGPLPKGPFLNKLIILPMAFLLSAVADWLIEPILVLGGVYLSFEGGRKRWSTTFRVVRHMRLSQRGIDEKARIRSAVLVDFILSVEIIILALSFCCGRHLGRAGHIGEHHRAAGYRGCLWTGGFDCAHG